jgi:endoglucanase
MSLLSMKRCILFSIFLISSLCKTWANQQTHSSASTSETSSWIRINQLGYTEKSIKVGVFVSKSNIRPKNFEIVDGRTDKVIFKSKLITAHGSYAAFTGVYRFNFSDFKVPGEYYLQSGNIKSPKFRISDDVYTGAADFLLKYMRQQRCGYNPFLKDSCHTHDGFIVGHPTLDSTYINVTGGWHDASDYLQYVTTSANATFQMMFAYQQNPQSFSDQYDANGTEGSNGIPDILDEVKWGLDWLDRMNPSYGVMFNQIADDRDHAGFRLPTDDKVDYGRGKQRPVYFITGKQQSFSKHKNRSTGVSSSAAKFASTFALGTKVLKSYYPEFAEKLSEKAQEAYRFAKSDLGVSQTVSIKAPYFYEEDNYVDDLELAAIQLYKLTNEDAYLKDAIYWGDLEPATPWMIFNHARHYQWYPFLNLGHYHIAAASQDSVTKSRFTNHLKKGLDAIYERGEKNGFKMGVPFIWCSNNLNVAAMTQMRLYHQLSGDKKFLEMEASLRDWLFGCNPWGTSMIVGFPKGTDTPVDPHSSFTIKNKFPIDGGLVDGPVYTHIFKSLIGLKLTDEDEYAPFQSDLCVYHDDYGDYSTNEPTMDGTASLTYYLSLLSGKQK